MKTEKEIEETRMDNKGICEACGKKSTILIRFLGKWLCEDCKNRYRFGTTVQMVKR